MPSSAFQSDDQSGIIAEAQPKRRRKGRKSMNRRKGQNGTVVISGSWYRVRWRLDVEGQEKRINMNEKVAPVVFDRNGNPKPPSMDVLRRARDIVEKSGANSEEHFNRIVLGEITFRNQADNYLYWLELATGSLSRTLQALKRLSISGSCPRWVICPCGMSTILP